MSIYMSLVGKLAFQTNLMWQNFAQLGSLFVMRLVARNSFLPIKRSQQFLSQLITQLFVHLQALGIPERRWIDAGQRCPIDNLTRL